MDGDLVGDSNKRPRTDDFLSFSSAIGPSSRIVNLSALSNPVEEADAFINNSNELLQNELFRSVTEFRASEFALRATLTSQLEKLSPQQKGMLIIIELLNLEKKETVLSNIARSAMFLELVPHLSIPDVSRYIEAHGASFQAIPSLLIKALKENDSVNSLLTANLLYAGLLLG